MKPLDAPDEIAHLEAVMDVRKKHIVPEIHFDFNQTGVEIPVVGNPGDQAVRDYALSFGKVDPHRLVPYESTQPPLYYIVAGLLAHVVPPDPPVMLYFSRFVSVLFGAATVFFCWAAARQFAPRAPMWAVAAAGAIALLPQFSFNSATVNNDSALNFGVALLLYTSLHGLRQADYDPRMLKTGAALGLAVLAKLTAVGLIPAVGLVLVFRAFQVGYGRAISRERLVRGGRMLLGIVVGAGTVCGWWFVRNIFVYGDPSGSQDVIKYYMMTSVSFDPDSPASWKEFLQSTWLSMWGRFGWMERSLPERHLEWMGTISIVLLALSAVALAWVALRWILRRGFPTYVWQGALVLLVAAITIIASYIQFNDRVAMQAQGRYLFSLLLPASLVFTGGLHALLPWRFLKIVALGVLLIWLAYSNWLGVLIVRGII